MGLYTNSSCPVCSKKFKEDDDIVVCPICGAPHHRDCYNQSGHCANIHNHGKQESYKRPDEKTYDGKASSRCSRCGAVNPAGNLFCNICGTPLSAYAEKAQANNGSVNNNNIPFQGAHPMAYNPYTTPFGGLDPEEQLNDIPVKDIALYVGDSSFYFLPKFKDMVNGKKSTFINWPVFFFDAFYFAYRKMFGFAVVVFIISLLLSIPSLITTFVTYASIGGLDIGIKDVDVFLDNIYAYQAIFSILSFAFKIALSFTFNKFYMKHVFKKIKTIKAQGLDEQTYYETLAKKGGVSRKIIVIILISTMALSVLSSLLILFL